MKTHQKIDEHTILCMQNSSTISMMTSKAVKAKSKDLVPPRLSLEDPIETVGISKMGFRLKTYAAHASWRENG